MTLKLFNILLGFMVAANMLLQSWMSYDAWLSGGSLPPYFAGIINMCLIGIIYWSAQFLTTPRYIVTKIVYHKDSIY